MYIYLIFLKHQKSRHFLNTGLVCAYVNMHCTFISTVYRILFLSTMSRSLLHPAYECTVMMAPALSDCTAFYRAYHGHHSAFYRTPNWSPLDYLWSNTSLDDAFTQFHYGGDQSSFSFHLYLSFYLCYTGETKKSSKRRQHVAVPPVHAPQVARNTIETSITGRT